MIQNLSAREIGVSVSVRETVVSVCQHQYYSKKKERPKMAYSSKYVQPPIPKFDGHYDHWAKLMENFLHSKQYWQLVEHGILEVENKVIASEAELKLMEEQRLKDLKTKNYLNQAIDQEILDIILNDDTSKHIWDSMKQKFQRSTRVKRAQLQALRRDFEMLQMKDGETVNS